MKHYAKIDGLRFIAICLVLIAHFGSYLDQHIAAGYYGVDLFFVISGFLITTILFKAKGSFWSSYKNFIGRRTLRIFPIYYITILLLYILQLDAIKSYLGYSLTYTFNYAWVKFSIPFNPVSHFWSLCVEEQFYLFWPFIVLSLNKNYRVLLLLTVFIIIVSFSQMTFGLINEINEYNMVNLLTRMGSLGTGGLAAILFNTNKIPNKFFKSKMVEYFTLFLLIFLLLTNYPFKYILFAYCSFYLVVKCAHSEFNFKIFNEFLKNRTVVFIGSISYGIYVFHLPIGFYVSAYIFDPIWSNIDFKSFGSFEEIKNWAWVIKLPLYSFLSILIASLSFKYIEKPILKLKDRYFSYK
jgi:peptidoglycan/LPS O-acetylase OafA/YrhL